MTSKRIGWMDNDVKVICCTKSSNKSIVSQVPKQKCKGPEETIHKRRNFSVQHRYNKTKKLDLILFFLIY